MSFKDLRSFTEMMRSLGYPRQISMDNFRQPNFALVAEILIWLVKRYEPNVNLPQDVDTEDDRVIFIKYVSHFMATKTRVKLNPKKLYMADGYSVQEMLKIVTLLYNAVKTNNDNVDDSINEQSFDISNKIAELKQARQLATDITLNGAMLYELLAMEVDLRELRLSAIGRPLEIDQIEKGLSVKISNIEAEIRNTQNKLDNIGNDEANLQSKIDKKRGELERNSKRLRTLQNVRPAFMDEFEKLEGELKRYYEVYAEKYRNLTYLEQLVENYDRQQQRKVEETENQLKRMQEQMKEEEKRLFNQTDTFENMIGDESEGEVDRKNGPRVIGGMHLSDSEDASDYITSGSEMEGEDIPLSGDEEEDTDDETDGLSGKDSDDADF